jgi:hypothetical protein
MPWSARPKATFGTSARPALPGIASSGLVRRFRSHFLRYSCTNGAKSHQPSGNALGKPITNQRPQPCKGDTRPSLALSGQRWVCGNVNPGRSRWADESVRRWRECQRSMQLWCHLSKHLDCRSLVFSIALTIRLARDFVQQLWCHLSKHLDCRSLVFSIALTTRLARDFEPDF